MKNRIGATGSDHERACGRVAARFGELWLRAYAGRKLRSDPVFPAAFELLQHSADEVTDVGCGVGLLGLYLRERNFRPPVIGIDSDGRKIARARTAAAGYTELYFIEQEAGETVSRTGSIVLFDVLHYLPPAEQEHLLARLIPQIAPGGLLLIRDCPRDRNARFWLTHLAERFAQIITWNVSAPLHFPDREEICAHFLPQEFESEIQPLWGSTPFNNHLFIFRRRTDATAPTPGARSGSPPSLATRA